MCIRDSIWGVELDPDTMTPIGEKKELIFGREEELGYERRGNNGIVDKEASVLYKACLLYTSRCV